MAERIAYWIKETRKGTVIHLPVPEDPFAPQPTMEDVEHAIKMADFLSTFGCHSGS